MADSATRRVSATPEALTIEWTHGGVSEFASLWLRDNLREDRDPHSGQRLIDITDLPAQPRIRAARAENGAVHIEWESEPRPARFELAWLAAQAAGGADRPVELRRRLWLEGARLDARREFAWAEWLALRADAGVRLGLLSRLVQDGIAFVHALPRREAAFLEAMALIGVIADTNYGRTFQVRSLPQPENLAYSDLGLGLHTDNPYREP
ncbi:MAG TPA: gamma-butyrobetaine hydroxylase-like domain-containing protein, partial [Steroidobacteraceae bacterium]|nr:gamma-butyrobetaine hydroxylase-like domain-containing protein [Steroidobacteraceae bacterium]